MKRYVLDTHALVWFPSRDNGPSDTAAAVLRDSDVQLIIPTVGVALVQMDGVDGILTRDESITASGLVSTIW